MQSGTQEKLGGVVETTLEPDGRYLLEVGGLTKIFGTLKACDHVDLKIRRGEIHSLLGENGAGKSTLVKMLFGSLEPNSGEILWKGEPVRIASPGAARKLGIGMVFQHFSLFEALTAAENIALSLDDKTPISTIAAKAKALSYSYGLPLDPYSLVGDLSVGERQRIEIIRCLLQTPQLIILDEPTSVLTPQEADKLFETLERLRSEGKSILYISHRLEEVKRMCDAATVLRHGKVVGHCDPRQGNRGFAGSHDGRQRGAGGRAPAGRGLGTRIRRCSRSATSIASRQHRSRSRSRTSISTSGGRGDRHCRRRRQRPGRAVRGDLRRSAAAARRARSASAARTPASLSISGRRLLGAAFVPEERLGHGAAPRMKLSENLLLSRHKTDRKVFLGAGGMVRSRRHRRGLAAHHRGHGRAQERASTPRRPRLSGGNLQKFIIGRELDRQPSVMVVNQPTWGVDAGAAARIRQALIELARSGSAVLVISQDLDELFEISDAIAVMHNGELSKPLPRRRGDVREDRPADGRRRARPCRARRKRWPDAHRTRQAAAAVDASTRSCRHSLRSA